MSSCFNFSITIRSSLLILESFPHVPYGAPSLTHVVIE